MNFDPYQPPSALGERSPHDSPPRRVRHSGPGIASIAFWAFGVLGLCVTLSIIGAFTRGADAPPGADAEMVAGMGLLLALQTVIIGAVLAVVGILIAERRRLYAFIGLVLNFGTLLLFATLFLLGWLMTTGDAL